MFGSKANVARRVLLLGGVAVAGAAALGIVGRSVAVPILQGEGPVPGTFEVTHTDEEWLKILGQDAFDVMRRQGTEQRFTSALLDEHRDGTFICAGCDLPLFDSSKKFDSGTGWPSFWDVLENAVGFIPVGLGDYAECHCRRCGGHLGHLFHDVPDQPLNNRYCIDGVALKFVPRGA